MADLTDALDKLARAEKHMADYNADSIEWLESNMRNLPAPVAKRFEPSNPEGTTGCFIYCYAGLPGEADRKLALVLGDALSNFRAAIDYLAWQLASDPPVERLVQFPLSDTRSQFVSDIARQIPNIDPMHRTIVERYQPYQWPANRRELHPLRVLNRLVRHDKHRSLRLVAAMTLQVKADVPSEYGNFRVSRVDAIELVPSDEVRPIEPDTELLRIHGAAIDPSEDFEIKVKWHKHQVALRIVDEPVLAELALRHTKNMITDLLDEFRRIL